MFWDKGYTPSQNIEALLEKENATVEEFLDDDDILQECKSLKKSIVNYFTRPEVIKRLVELITIEPSDELPMVQRFRHANMASEILTLGLPSLDEKLLSDADILKTLYSYLENEPPLNPLLSSFFSKTFSMLFTKKPEQDWFLYQQMCLQLLEYIKSQNNFLDLICKHFSTPVIPDLVMQMMTDIEGGQLKRNLFEWLTEGKLVERLIAVLGNPEEIEKHANVADFLCDLIQQGRIMRQTEYENDSFEPAFEGSNPILKTIEGEATTETLLNVILEPNAQESSIVSGITVVLTLIRPLTFVEEPHSDRLKFIQNREKQIHEQILATVIRVIAPRLKDFHELLSNPPNKAEIVTTAAKLTPPFGMTRLQICRLFTVLLQTNSEEILKAICETNFFETLLVLFKQYCWNNFLHSEVEKCLHLVFYTQLSNNNNNSTQGSTIVNDGSFSKNGNNDADNTSSFFDYFKSTGNTSVSVSGSGNSNENVDKDSVEDNNMDATTANTEKESDDSNKEEIAEIAENATNEIEANEESKDLKDEDSMQEEAASEKKPEQQPNSSDEIKSKDEAMQLGESGDHNDATKTPADNSPSALQTHVIVNCKLLSKLIDCWTHNQDSESAEKRRRLGYMGHLIQIFKHITNCISESEHIGALIESNLSDAGELDVWQSIINPTDGDFTKALATQSKMLANCNAHETGDYSQHLPKDFLDDNSTWDYVMSSNMINNLGAFNDSSTNDIVFALEHEMYRNDDNLNADNDLKMFEFCRNIDDYDDDDDVENNAAGDGHGLFGKSVAFRATNNPWENVQPFSNSTPWSSAGTATDGFADFDSYFNTFTSDMGESLNSPGKKQNIDDAQKKQQQNDSVTTLTDETKSNAPEFDNNANVEKSSTASVTATTATTSVTPPAAEVVNKYLEDDDNEKNEKVVETIVRTLQSVIQDSEDDYEDDEGMWTKPLGSSAVDQHSDEENTKADEDELLEIKQNSLIANGPSSKQTTIENKDQDNEELNNSINTTKNITAANITALNSESITNNTPIDNEDMETKLLTNDKDAASRQANSILDAASDKKLACNAASTETTNPVEIAPTTT